MSGEIQARLLRRRVMAAEKAATGRRTPEGSGAGVMVIWPELTMLRVLTTPAARLSASVSMLKEKDSRPSGPDQPNVKSVALGAGVEGLAAIWRGQAEPRSVSNGEVAGWPVSR